MMITIELQHDGKRTVIEREVESVDILGDDKVVKQFTSESPKDALLSAYIDAGRIIDRWFPEEQ